MILRRERLAKFPVVFRALTGLTVALFEAMLPDLVAAFHADRRRRLDRPRRQRAFGGGDDFDLTIADQFLLTIVWLRHYPTQEVLGYLFGVSDSSALRAVARCLPLLEAAGKDTMRMPDPGRGRRKNLPALLKETPGLAVVLDTFEQPVQRPRRRQKRYSSGKKKRHTLKSQVAVDEETGQLVDVAESVPGPTADLEVLKQSKLLNRLPKGVGALGDLAYLGVAALHREGLGATPRRKPRGQERSPEDRRYHRAFARRRIVVEHGICRLRRYQALTQVDRHHRKLHTARVRAAAGLVNRMMDHRKVA
ncbi:MAG TPA: transposase family protein [Gemmataceae bacterium]|nr:transposase family protein [Gemmataceae bacterium]